MTDTPRETAVSAAEADPAEIDLNKVRALRSTSFPPDLVDTWCGLIAAVEALRERVVEQDKLIARLEDVLKGTGLRNSDLEARAEAHATELAETLRQIIKAIDRTTTSGEIRHGHNEVKRLAGKAFATLPTHALERARAKDEVVKAARLVAEARAIEVGSTPLRQENLRNVLAKLDTLDQGDGT